MERVAEGIGVDIEERAKPNRESAVTGKVVTLESKRTATAGMRRQVRRDLGVCSPKQKPTTADTLCGMKILLPMSER